MSREGKGRGRGERGPARGVKVIIRRFLEFFILKKIKKIRWLGFCARGQCLRLILLKRRRVLKIEMGERGSKVI